MLEYRYTCYAVSDSVTMAKRNSSTYYNWGLFSGVLCKLNSSVMHELVGNTSNFRSASKQNVSVSNLLKYLTCNPLPGLFNFSSDGGGAQTATQNYHSVRFPNGILKRGSFSENPIFHSKKRFTLSLFLIIEAFTEGFFFQRGHSLKGLKNGGHWVRREEKR